MQINYKFVEFHSPVFASGKNFGTKIHAKEGIKLYYDTDLEFMCMEYKGNLHHFDSFHSADMAEEIKEKKAVKAKNYQGE